MALILNTLLPLSDNACLIYHNTRPKRLSKYLSTLPVLLQVQARNIRLDKDIKIL